MFNTSRLIGSLTISLMLVQSIAFASTEDAVAYGANAKMKYAFVQSQEGDADDKSDEIQKKDNVYVEAFDHNYDIDSEDEDEDKDEDEDEYLVIGMEIAFDTVFFNLDTPAEFADKEEGLKWEYLSESGWENLEVDDSNLDNFTRERGGDYKVSFDMPKDWSSESFEDEDAYWIRVKADSEIMVPARVDQISAVAYNLQITISDKDGNKLTNLDSSNFALANGDDNKVYAVKNLGNGVYQLAVQAEENDTSYSVLVSSKSHWQVALEPKDEITDSLTKISYGGLVFDSNCLAPYSDIDYHWAQSSIRELYCKGILEDEDEFNPNSKISRAEFVKMLIMSAGIEAEKYKNYPMPFEDVPSEYKEYVASAYTLGVLEDSEYFNPEKTLSRAQAVTMLVRLVGLSTDESDTDFEDVKESAWYAPYVKTAYERGMVEGYVNNTFRPERKLSKAESAVMLNNIEYSLDLE